MVQYAKKILNRSCRLPALTGFWVPQALTETIKAVVIRKIVVNMKNRCNLQVTKSLKLISMLEIVANIQVWAWGSSSVAS